MTNLEIASSRRYLRIVLGLVKPRIIELLLVTAVPALILAARGWPSWITLIAVVGFGTLAAAGANSWNSIIERETDALMKRTQHRPLVTGDLSKNHASLIAIFLTISSVLGMYLFTNVQAALLTAAAIGFYVLGYTIILKPRTNQNIVWGGIAGCFPVVIADAAINEQVSVGAWILFALIFFWTPAHYWPLAAHYKDDYSLADIPMLPVEKSAKVVAGWTLIYTVLTILVSIIFYLFTDIGYVYLVTAIAFGAGFLILSTRYLVSAIKGAGTSPMTVFHFSITYLAVLFLAVAVDVLI
jgi:protoheme IX farnesyltransferase